MPACAVPPPVMSSVMLHPREFGFVGSGQVEAVGDDKTAAVTRVVAASSKPSFCIAEACWMRSDQWFSMSSRQKSSA